VNHRILYTGATCPRITKGIIRAIGYSLDCPINANFKQHSCEISGSNFLIHPSTSTHKMIRYVSLIRPLAETLWHTFGSFIKLKNTWMKGLSFEPDYQARDGAEKGIDEVLLPSERCDIPFVSVYNASSVVHCAP
jgi:hypothetical protein